jgi:hypothetical protein
MEVWVRSQSKDVFVCIKSVCYDRLSLNEHCILGDRSWLLGRYGTQERCLEIIDEIQSFISFDKNVCTFTESGGGSFVYEDKVSCVIYTMPQE